MKHEAQSLPRIAVFARGFDPVALAEAIVEVALCRDELGRNARAIAGAIRERHSIRSFMDVVLRRGEPEAEEEDR